MIEICRLKNVVIFVQTILGFVLSRKIIFKVFFIPFLVVPKDIKVKKLKLFDAINARRKLFKKIL